MNTLLPYAKKIVNIYNLKDLLSFFWFIENRLSLLRLFFGQQIILSLKSNRIFVNLNVRDFVDLAIIFEIFYKHTYPVKETMSNCMVLDIGGHSGYFSVYAKTFMPNCVVHAFEPSEGNYENFRKNIELNKLGDIVLNDFGVSSIDEVVTFYQYENSADNSTNKIQGRNGKETAVKLVQLSEYIRKNNIQQIEYLKIDIEGGEYKLFSDQDYSYLQNVREMFMEIHGDKMYDGDHLIKDLSKLFKFTRREGILVYFSNRPMKVLLGVPEFPPFAIGGGGEIFRKLAIEYRKAGEDVVVIYGKHASKSIFDKVREFVDTGGVKFYEVPEIPCPNFLPFLRTVLPTTVWNMWTIKKILKKEKPDVANLHGYGLYFVSQLSRCITKLKIPYLLTLHGAPVSQNKSGLVIKVGYWFYKFFYGNFLLKNSKKITAVSNYTLSFPEFKKYTDKVGVIHNGIDVDALVDVPKRQENFFSKFGNYGESDIRFFSLGRIEWLKGFQYFIEILPSLIQAGKSPKYYIAGADNGHKKTLQEQMDRLGVINNVVFVGKLDLEDKVNAIRSSDYVVVPSLIENYPAVPLESVVLGKICIANDAGGIPEIIKDKENGILCDVMDSVTFSERVVNLIQDADLQGKINNKMKGDVKNYSWDAISRQYIDLLKSIKD